MNFFMAGMRKRLAIKVFSCFFQKAAFGLPFFVTSVKRNESLNIDSLWRFWFTEKADLSGDGLADSTACFRELFLTVFFHLFCRGILCPIKQPNVSANCFSIKA